MARFQIQLALIDQIRALSKSHPDQVEAVGRCGAEAVRHHETTPKGGSTGVPTPTPRTYEYDGSFPNLLKVAG